MGNVCINPNVYKVLLPCVVVVAAAADCGTFVQHMTTKQAANVRERERERVRRDLGQADV